MMEKVEEEEKDKRYQVCEYELHTHKEAMLVKTDRRHDARGVFNSRRTNDSDFRANVEPITAQDVNIHCAVDSIGSNSRNALLREEAGTHWR